MNGRACGNSVQLVLTVAVLFLQSPSRAGAELTSRSTPKEQPVISVSWQPADTAIISPKTGKKIIPGIDIYSGGLVAVRRADGSEVEKHLDPRKVTRLLHRLARTKFYNVTGGSFTAEVTRDNKSAQPERIVIIDSPLWKLSACSGGVVHSTQFRGSWDMAEHFQNSNQLNRLKYLILKVYRAVDEEVPSNR